MSTVTIEPTKYVNERTGEVRYGFRIHDDVDCFYCDTWDNIPDDDFAILSLVRENSAFDICSMVDCLVVEKKSVRLGATFYRWEEIKTIFTTCSQRTA